MTDDEPDADDGRTEYDRGDKEPLKHGTKIRAKLKRGTGTRDQDTLLIEGRGEDAAEAAADFEDALSRAEENDWADRLRAIQLEEDADE